MKLLLSICTFSLMLTAPWAMEAVVDQPSPDETARPLFKKLRTQPNDLAIQDFREIYKIMEFSIASRSKGDQTYYRGNYEVGHYFYTLISHTRLGSIFNEEELEYTIHLKCAPKKSLFHTKCTFEVLVESKRLFDFTMSYVSKMAVKFSTDQKLLKGLQAKKTNDQLEKFLERPPVRQDSTIKASREAMHKAKETALDVRQTVEGRYSDPEQAPLTSRTTKRPRAFSELRAATRSHIDRTPHLKKQRLSSETSEEEEKKDKGKVKETKKTKSNEKNEE
jgi:hypothetical protein